MSASRVIKFFRTPFGLAVAALMVLAGWSLWTAGAADNDLQRAARSGSIYAAAGVELNTEAAAEVIGNRRLFVAFLEPDADLARACRQVSRPAEGTLALLLSSKEGSDSYNSYGCSLLPGEGTDAFGRAFVAESMIRRGINVFADRPLDALKVTVVNYDMLVKAGTVPDHARTISPSLPRYLIALAAVAAVLAGSALAYLGARRAGKLAGQRAQSRAAAGDAQSSLNARAAVLAKHIIELDRRYEGAAHRGFGAEYRAIVSEYTDLVEELAEESRPADELATWVDDLIERCRKVN
ncbi:adhesion protein FadA [Hoyosella sp. YIM 151337]|uniref:adhesion protein FadA n=1 Tax=Hoyosella sp. YIM 151337 TaxID=2992742 RepID=UPI002236653F|nr:adhesion protein FadA [Hoyosella sp. YIM 151337]MCW4354697.1 adhesion protein FadA [Hoyosella sp. YIM 151337]